MRKTENESRRFFVTGKPVIKKKRGKLRPSPTVHLPGVNSSFEIKTHDNRWKETNTCRHARATMLRLSSKRATQLKTMDRGTLRTTIRRWRFKVYCELDRIDETSRRYCSEARDDSRHILCGCPGTDSVTEITVFRCSISQGRSTQRNWP